MKKMGRFFIRFALGLVAFILVIALGLFMFLDPVIKNSINVYAPKILGVSVSVEKIQIRPLRGTVYLENFKIGNPQGYSTNAPLFAVQKIRVGLNLLSVASSVIHVNVIEIKDPFIHYETHDGKTNIDALMENLQQGKKTETASTEKSGTEPTDKTKTVSIEKPKIEPTDKTEKTSTEKTETASTEEKQQKKVIIDEFSLHGTRVSYQGPFSLNKRVTIPIPSFEINDIGKKEGGIAAVDAFAQVLGSIITHLGEGIAELGKSTLKGAGDALNSAAEGGSKAIDSAVKSIKKLF